MDGQDYRTVVTSPAMREEIERYVEQLNAKLNRWETIKKFEILARDFSIESGELTPSMKLKRKVVEENFKDVLEGFYAG
jgi:long-chain acyl-CoA synthetase